MRTPHQYLLYALTLIFVLTLLPSCQKEELLKDEFTISEFRNWFETTHNSPPSHQIDAPCVTIFSSPDKKILWDKAKKRQVDGIKIVEVPVIFPAQYDLLDKNPNGKIKEDFLSITYLIIEENATVKQSKLMTIIPADELINRNKYIRGKNGYKKLQKEFSGKTIFHEWDGTFAGGTIYEDGKTIGWINSEQVECGYTKLKDNALESRYICYTESIDVWGRTCIDWYINGQYVDTQCDPWEIEETIYYEVCYEDGSGPNDGGGGDGGDPDVNWLNNNNTLFSGEEYQWLLANPWAIQYFMDENQDPDRPDLGRIGNFIRDNSKLNTDFEKYCFERWWLGWGNLRLSYSLFADIVNNAVISWDNPTQLYSYIKFPASVYENENYNYALGAFTIHTDLFYNITGLNDHYNFDWQSWGNRDFEAELATRGVSIFTPSTAKDYYINYP